MSEEKDLDIKEMINTLSKEALSLSILYAKDVVNSVADKDQLKHLNEIKKHLAFAKRLYKEMYPKDKGKQTKQDPAYYIKKLDDVANSVNSIVASMKD